MNDNSEWIPTTESRVRRVYSLLLKLVYETNNKSVYTLKESPEYIDLVFASGTSFSPFCYRFDKANNLITTRMVDYAPISDVLRVYSLLKGEPYLDNIQTFSKLVDQFAEIALDLNETILEGHYRPNITRVVLCALFAPRLLPPSKNTVYLLPDLE